MAESEGLARIFVFMGALMLLIIAFNPGSNAAWSGLTNTLSNPPTFPGNNPYARQVGTVTLPIVGNGTWGLDMATSTFGANAVSPSGTFGSAGGCGNGAHVNSGVSYPGDYWDCLNSRDGEASGVFLNGVSSVSASGTRNEGFGFNARLGNITGLDPRQRVLNITVSSQCNAATTINGTFNVNFVPTTPTLGTWGTPVGYPDIHNIGLAAPLGNATCDYGGLPPPFGGRWFNVTNYVNYQNGFMVGGQTLGNFSGAEMLVAVRQWGARIDISYMSVTINYLKENTVSNPKCDSLDIGCQFGNFVNWLGDVFSFFAGLIAYGVAWIVWIVSVGVGIGSGIILSLIWVLAIPGMPPEMQAILDVFIIGTLAYVFVVFVFTVRGRGTGAG